MAAILSRPQWVNLLRPDDAPGNYVNISSCNDYKSAQHQAITRINADVLLT